MPSEHGFVFASLGERAAGTARNVHIRRLFDALHLCLQRGDMPRAARAWAILARCKQVQWREHWRLGLLILSGNQEHGDDDQQKLDFLRIMMLQRADEREAILQEIVLLMITTGDHRKALDELQLYLPSFPYQENPILHTYAGMLCLYLSQPFVAAGEREDSYVTRVESTFNLGYLRDAQTHLERALELDPDNIVARQMLNKLHEMTSTNSDIKFDSDTEMEDDFGSRPAKKMHLE